MKEVIRETQELIQKKMDELSVTTDRTRVQILIKLIVDLNQFLNGIK